MDKNVRELALRALSAEERLNAMRAAFMEVKVRQKQNMSIMSDLERKKAKLREAKERILKDIKRAVDELIPKLESAGIRVYFAKTREEALNFILREVKGEKVLVKSKSNVSKEIHLTRELERKGIEVVETDIGDRIIQLAGEKPAHPTGPACHFSRTEIAQMLSRTLNIDVEPDPQVLVRVIKENIEKGYRESRIGIIGANAIALNEGALVAIHNEGNISRILQDCEKVLIITSIDKILPSLEDALNAVLLQTFYATGSITTSFINIVSGPSKTADIEKKLYRGVHGAKDLCLILLDAGRTNIIEAGFGELLYCIGCGYCLVECPVYNAVGNVFGGDPYLGGRGVCFTALTEGLERGVEAGLFLCTECYRCGEVCPVQINAGSHVETIREMCEEKDLYPDELKNVATNILTKFDPFGAGIKARLPKRERRSETLLFIGCTASISYKDIAVASFEILEFLGVDFTFLGRDEICCGGPLLLIGMRRKFNEIMEMVRTRMENMGISTVITVCPMCLRTFKKHYRASGINFLHITEILAEAIESGKLRLKMPSSVKVTYHDPCHLGRHLGIYDPPRKVLESIENLEFVEMEESRNLAWCCGGPLNMYIQEVAEKMSDKIGMMAQETDAERISTACPTCYHNLITAAFSYGLEACDILHLVRESKKESG
ncbi:MAG: LUD domain-containing protein [Candidatus Baldrarchaeia archaeon]